MLFDDIKVTKRVTITNGKKYNFFIYDVMTMEKEFSEKKVGKGDTVISKVTDFKMLDEETDEMLDVKLRIAKRPADHMDGLEAEESPKVFKKSLKELEKRDLVRTKKEFLGPVKYWCNKIIRRSLRFGGFFVHCRLQSK